MVRERTNVTIDDDLKELVFRETVNEDESLSDVLTAGGWSVAVEKGWVDEVPEEYQELAP